MDNIFSVVESLVARWQEVLGDSVEVILGGSLVSGLLIMDEETEAIDMDVRFLTERPLDEELRSRIETVTGLRYRKTITVNDWPTGTSEAVMVEGFLSVDGLNLPLEVEGCIRNPRYVGWARFYKTVFTADELAKFRSAKIRLRHVKAEYKRLKTGMVEEAKKRCFEQGLVSK